MAALPKMLSAFSVKQAMLGKHKIDDEACEILSKKVQKLHADERLKLKAEQLDKMFRVNAAKKRRNIIGKKKRKREAAAMRTADQKGKKPNEPKLKWHNPPDTRKGKTYMVKSEPDELPTQQRVSLLGRKDSPEPETTPALNGHTSEEEKLSNVLFDQDGDAIILKTQKKKKRRSGKKGGEGFVVVEDKMVKKNPAEFMKPHFRDDSSLAVKEKTAKKTPADFVKLHVTDANGDVDMSDDKFSPMEHTDPEQEVKEVFAQLVHPYTRQTFMRSYWTKKPLHIRRSDPEYYDELDIFSTDELDRILREENVRFGTNIDVTTYRDGKRETHNPAGRAYPAIVWDYYQQGCSVRLLNPQTYSQPVWQLLSTLQEMFGCMVGANVYLTPAGTQGFAPHYDDIEGFVLQLEGRKHWKVYPPRTDADIWPLTSSSNLTEAELGEPLVDSMLEPGDLLYFPRGAIHQAMAQNDEHSLHITVSTHQKNTWSDLLNIMLPAALSNATENDVKYRASLPNDYLNYTGVAFQEQHPKRRQVFFQKVCSLIEGLIDHAPIDGACDQMAKKYIHDSLPPSLTSTEAAASVADQGERWVTGYGVVGIIELEPDTCVRLIRKHSLRLVQDCDDDAPTENPENKSVGSEEKQAKEEEEEDEESFIRVYYNTDNNRLYHGNTLQHFDIDTKLAPAIEFLQVSFPKFVSIDDFPCDEVTDKLDIAMQLYDHGLLVTEVPLEPAQDDLHMGAQSDCSDDQEGSEPEVHTDYVSHEDEVYYVDSEDEGDSEQLEEGSDMDSDLENGEGSDLESGISEEDDN